MKTETYYEWSVEETDEHGDIVDSNFADKVSNLKNHEGSLVLVWNQGNEADGVTDRSWAYVEDGKLPVAFENGTDVPEHFHKELAEHLS